MSTSIYPAVTAYQDGTDHKVEARELNRPINQLKQRTDYLYDRIQVLTEGGVLESVRLQDVVLDDGAATRPSLYDAVYMDPATYKFKKASATTEVLPEDMFASLARAAFSVGILVAVSGDLATGDVVLCGRTAVADVDAMMQTGETFTPGPYYLSASAPGKLTRNYSDIAVYVGYMVTDSPSDSLIRTGSIVVMPQYKDMWESHVHKRLPLASQIAGQAVLGADTIVRGFPADGGSGVLNMSVFGEYAGEDPVTYTILVSDGAVTNLGGTVNSLFVSWTSSDGRTGGPFRIGYLERLVPIGDGLSVSFELASAFSGYTAADFNPMVPTISANNRTWTLTVPDDIRGWRQHAVRKTAEQVSSNAREYRLTVFGVYRNPEATESETLTITGSGSGSFTAGNGSVTVVDSLGSTLATITNMSYGAVYQIMAGPCCSYDLWLLVSKFDENGAEASSGVVNATDQWRVSFTDEAPGSAYEYAMDTDKSVNTYYPAAPATQLLLEKEGLMLEQRGEFAADEGIYLPGNTTIYWYGWTTALAPWPDKKIAAYFSLHRVPPHGMVRSLTPLTAGAVRLVDCNGTDATTGDLFIAVDLSLAMVDELPTDARDGKAVVGLKNIQLVRGPVVREIIPGPGVTILESTTKPGTWSIGASNLDSTGEFNIVNLFNAKQEIVQGGIFSYIRLMPYNSAPGATNIPNSFSMQMRVPYSLGDQSYRLLFYLTMFGTTTPGARVAAGLKMTYNMLEDYDLPAGGQPELVEFNLISDIISDDVTADVWFESGYTAYDLMVLHNDAAIPDIPGQTQKITDPMPFLTEGDVLRPGDLFALKLERAATTENEYTGSLGFIALKWTLSAVSA